MIREEMATMLKRRFSPVTANMEHSQSTESKRPRTVGIATLIGVVVVFACADLVSLAQAPDPDAADRFGRTRAFLLAAYPRLASRSDLVIWFETDKVPLHPRGERAGGGASEKR